MATAEERMRVLKLIQKGAITANEGARLLNALDKSRREAQRSERRADRTAAPPGRQVRLRVSDSHSGATRVNMTLPLSLVNMGLAVGARFVPDVAALDAEQVRQSLQGGTPGKVLEVLGEDGELVEIFIE